MKCKFCKPFVLIFMQNDGGWGCTHPQIALPWRASIFYFLFSIFYFPFSIYQFLFSIFRHFFLPAGGRSFSSSALMAFTSAAPLARNSPMRSRATCSSSFSPRGSGITRTRLRSSRLRLRRTRSEEHTSELQSRGHLVCRLL